MKILIAGDGKVGATLTRRLSAEGYDLTLIDSNAKVLESSMERYDVMTIQGNCASMDVLAEAGAKDADLLIAATSADEVNLLCCLTAHCLNPKLHTIARIRNPEYSDQIYYMRKELALSLAVNPEKQAAGEIERLLQFPGFLKRETFAKGRVEIVELRIDGKSKLRDIPLSVLNVITRCKVLVCVVLRDGKAIAPDGHFVLRENDRIFVTAPNNVLATLLKNLGLVTHRVNRVILVGGGRVSFYLAQQLIKSGVNVEIIESNHERCVELAGLLPEVTIVNGDASNQALLEGEGLNRCDALVALTGLDELNMITSLYANASGVPQVITKVGHIEATSIFNSLQLGSLVCPKELCCDTIIRYVRAIQNQAGAALAVHLLADGQAEAIEFLVDEKTLHCGEPLKKIKLKENILIACITHGKTTELPSGESSFKQGDTLVLVTSRDSVVYQINEIFK